MISPNGSWRAIIEDKNTSDTYSSESQSSQQRESQKIQAMAIQLDDEVRSQPGGNDTLAQTGYSLNNAVQDPAIGNLVQQVNDQNASLLLEQLSMRQVRFLVIYLSIKNFDLHSYVSQSCQFFLGSSHNHFYFSEGILQSF